MFVIGDYQIYYIIQDSDKTFNILFSASGGCRGRDRMVVGFRTTCAIRAYHH
jgi:hypothetical protein